MNKDQATEGLKKKIEEGFIVLDEENRMARIGANLDGYPKTIWGPVLLASHVMGYRAELTKKHGYRVDLDPAVQAYLSLPLWSA